MEEIRTDVVVVGAGNAAFCAAMAARDAGVEVLVLERAPFSDRGGNSAYTSGAMRVAHSGLEDLLLLMPDLSEEEQQTSDFGTYTEEVFFEDLATVSEYRADPDMAEMLVRGSFPALRWMQNKGIQFLPQFRRQAFKVGGKHKFWGEPVGVSGGGAGLVERWFELAEAAEVDIRYETRATELITEEGYVRGLRATTPEGTLIVMAEAVVLAAGGFQANAEWRTRYLGAGWDLAKVRGTRFNTGDGIRMALDVGAMPYGNWSQCHAVGWDRNAPDFGDVKVGDGFNKHNYPLGIMVNARGERFVDEGADHRNKTYAKYGREILKQPGETAWQIFDAKVADLLLPDFYRHRQVTRVAADTLDELVDKLEGVDAEVCLRTIEEYNDAVCSDAAFNPAIKDGRCTVGITPPKSNWAQRLDTPPYEAFAVTCGITFTFGGVRINQLGQVLDQSEKPLDGLYACGEMVGGLFYHNYPGGTGLTWGAVGGIAAGTSAGDAASSR